MGTTNTAEQIRAVVRERYANAAKAVSAPTASCGCGSDCCATESIAVTQASTNCCEPECCGADDRATATDAFGAAAYAADELTVLPVNAVAASLGCGNPTALAELRPGEVVLDLGSGGGIDVLLSARRVGPTGKAYGLDMTDEMLALARANQRTAGITNVEFLRGQIEAIPLPADTVDVVISNCVVNLSTDKDAVLRETYRVLRPGGRVAISDVVIRDADPDEADIPTAVRRDLELWAGCVAGALEAGEYRATLAAAGFTQIEIAEVRRYSTADLTGDCCGSGADLTADGALTDAVASRFISAFVRAVKPS